MAECLFLTFFILLLIGVPISICLALAAAAAMLFYSHFSLDVIVTKFYSASDSFPLIAIPFFVMAGSIMSKGGMSQRLINLALSVVGNIRGGLAMVSVIACMFFACVSGSTAATTAAIGVVLVPAIIKTGFSPGAATSLQATAGSIGIIIPPSLPFVLLGVISGISIGELFLGGVLPGIIVGIALMAVAHFTARIQHHPPSGQAINPVNIARAFYHSILSLLTVVFILGGIMLGLVTPTEAAIVAVVWSLIVCLFIYRELHLNDFPDILVGTVKITGIVVLCIGASSPFAWLMTVEHIPSQVADALLQLTDNPIVIKLIMIVLLLVVGTFIDLTPAMILLFPILMPIAEQLHMQPVHFGVMMVMALGIGQCTPPVGIGLFVACSVSGTKIGDVVMPLIPYLLAMVIALLLTAFSPALATWLPLKLMN